MAELVKVAYRPLGMLASLGAAALAGKAFTAIWKRVARSDTVPGALNADDRMTRVVIAAVLQAAIFAATQAWVDRAGAHLYKRITGSLAGLTWPD